MGAKPAPPLATQSLTETCLALWQHPELFLMRLVLMALVLILAALLYLLIRRVLARLHRQLVTRSTDSPEPVRRRLYRSLTIVGLLSSIVKWVIFVTAILSVLSIGGMNLWPVLTGAGIAGLAIGLGAQSLIKDFLSGFFIILEGQFAVGDYVTLGGIFGVVQEVGLRVTVLRDMSNQIQYIPNGSITYVTVYAAPKVDYALDFELPQGTDTKAAATALEGLLADLKTEFAPYVIDCSEVETRSLAGGLTALTAQLSVFPHQEWLATEELPARLLRRLKTTGLELPEDAKARVYVKSG
jgi:small conductance mechanosensitive channel